MGVLISESSCGERRIFRSVPEGFGPELSTGNIERRSNLLYEFHNNLYYNFRYDLTIIFYHIIIAHDLSTTQPCNLYPRISLAFLLLHALC